MTDEEAIAFARKHCRIWNSHDLDAIMGLYSESVELVSPLAELISGQATVRGQAQVREYFAGGLRKFPDLRFDLVDVFRSHSSITILFRGAGGRLVAEVIVLDADGNIDRVVAHYQCQPALSPEPG